MHLGPSALLDVEKPKIIHVCKPLSSEDHEVRVFEFSNVISSFPRSRLIFRRCQFPPNLCVPIQNGNCIEALFIGTSSSEDDD